MADTEISKLPELLADDALATDPLAIADLSAVETKKITISSLFVAGTRLVPEDSIDPLKINWGSITANQINGTAIIDRTLPAGKLVANSLTASEIAANAIGASELADNAVDTAAITADAVTAAKIADDQIGDEHIVTSGLGTASIALGAITRDRMFFVENDIAGSVIADNSITSGEIAANAVGSSELANNAVDTAAIQADAVTAAKIADDQIGNEHIVSTGLGTNSITDGAITRSKMTLNADDINGSIIADNTITANEIANNAIGSSELANNSVDTAALQANAVINEKIAGGAIAARHLTANIVGTSELIDASVTNTKLATNSVATSNVIDDAITADKLANNLPGTILAAGAIDTEGLADSSVSTSKLSNASVTNVKLADASVSDSKITGLDGTKIQEGTIPASAVNPNAFSNGIELDGTIQLSNEVLAGTKSGIQWNSNGLIVGYTDFPPEDLPIATSTTVGGISVPASSGFTVSETGVFESTNKINAGTTSGITYDINGNIVSTVPLQGADLPISTNTSIGGVKFPTDNRNPILVDSDGNVTHSASGIAPGTYVSTTVDVYGLVVDGDVVLALNQLPDIPASKITSGEFGTARIEDASITGKKIADYATCFMQEDTPGSNGEFLGQLWYQPSTAQLRVYARGSGSQNLWQAVGFGALQQQNLRVGFTYNATNSTIVSITQYGASAGLAAGEAIPTASDQLSGIYGVCVVAGENLTLNDLEGTRHTAGDWILAVSELVGWIHVDVTGEGGSGSGVRVLNDLLDVEIGGDALPDLEDNQILRYRSDIGQWVNSPLVAAVVVDDTPPNNAPPGALWWDKESGRLMVWYEGDNGVNQWVVATPESGLTGGNAPPVPIKTVLNDLDNVNALKNDGVLLTYNAANKQWESTGLIDSGSYTGGARSVVIDEDDTQTKTSTGEPDVLNDLTDVNADDTDGAFLQYSEGNGIWVAQTEFDAGIYGITREAEESEPEMIKASRSITQLNDFQDVQADKDDTAYLIYNDNLNRWESTLIIDGGQF